MSQVIALATDFEKKSEKGKILALRVAVYAIALATDFEETALAANFEEELGKGKKNCKIFSGSFWRFPQVYPN